MGRPTCIGIYTPPQDPTHDAMNPSIVVCLVGWSSTLYPTLTHWARNTVYFVLLCTTGSRINQEITEAACVSLQGWLLRCT